MIPKLLWNGTSNRSGQHASLWMRWLSMILARAFLPPTIGLLWGCLWPLLWWPWWWVGSCPNTSLESGGGGGNSSIHLEKFCRASARPIRLHCMAYWSPVFAAT